MRNRIHVSTKLFVPWRIQPGLSQNNIHLSVPFRI